MADVIMVYVIMAYIVMAYILMVHIVMAEAVSFELPAAPLPRATTHPCRRWPIQRHFAPSLQRMPACMPTHMYAMLVSRIYLRPKTEKRWSRICRWPSMTHMSVAIYDTYVGGHL